MLVERVDGAQARLKLLVGVSCAILNRCGKGGWGSGEIETLKKHFRIGIANMVERVDGAQARLKQIDVYR